MPTSLHRSMKGQERQAVKRSERLETNQQFIQIIEITLFGVTEGTEGGRTESEGNNLSLRKNCANKWKIVLSRVQTVSNANFHVTFLAQI